MSTIETEAPPPSPPASGPGSPGSGPDETHRDGAVNSKTARSLYAKRVKIHPKGVTGTFRTLKWSLMVVLLGVYYVMPWVRWDRGPNAPSQAILIDFPTQKFYFFFIEIWPQEVYYLTGILIMMAIGLFGLTSTVGRVWCGFGCPQTVWSDLFLWVERMVEGDRNARIKLDKAPMSPVKFAKRVIKHTLWIMIGAATGGAWVFYFADAPTLARELIYGTAPAVAYTTIAFLTSSTYIMAGWAREQVCTYMCPYARFQAAMLDEHSLVITYRAYRGEPRGKLKKNQAAPEGGRGDCVDCSSCVLVCPTGIDIRDGQQMECINCGLCADACDSVMDVIGRPRGLIALDTLSNTNAHAAGVPSKLRIVRPRTLIYIGLWCLVGLIMAVTLVTRANLKLDVLRDRNPLFVIMADGEIRNGYTFHVINKKHADRRLHLEVEGLANARISVLNDSNPSELSVGPDAVTDFRVWVTAPRASMTSDSADIRFVLSDPESKDTAVNKTFFRGPGK